ncbi:MAG: isoleucine--tRNA ligase [Holosporales bacterium]|nr:isoleucine--tRNA ligase [Holosporales bacterium]
MSNNDLSKTIFLPKTDFPMKGDLANKEPVILEDWKKLNLFKSLREKSKGREKFILHFGPPYANGDIHIGHALIGVLKDAVNKSYQMLGYDAPLVIGWDCHGLPIEWKIEENYIKDGKKRENVPVSEFLKKCRDFAEKWSNVQKKGFERLGIVFDTENPYCTMSKESEAVICEKFYEIYKKGLVYRGKNPVMWSVVEKTALAEAELEYKDKVSDAIYVKFPIAKAKHESLRDVFAVIWTTTPWTIPANKAIAYSENCVYSIIKANNEKYLIARDLIQAFINESHVEKYEVIETISGEDLKDTICEHPLRKIGYTLDVPLLPGEHVTTDAGTGLVHTAPAHGVEDFLLGKKYELDIEDIVNDDGTLIDTLPCFAGEHVFKVNPHVIEEIQKAENLLYSYQIVHSYPHSWRSKAPLIFRTTSQWFISIGKIRDQLLKAIDKTQWYPSGYINRIRSMVEKRPDWCISRQRLWGVPIALFIHKETGEVLVDDDVFSKVLKSIREEGLEAWHNRDIAYFLCDKYDASLYNKVSDTLEVWFDSACSHHYVLEQRDDMQWPANLYFEGSDQHRGWFQSSLVESVCTTGEASYKQVATNGFVLDKDGKKMSKSLGNVISPEEVINKYGADVLRLWCLTSDYSEDLRIGEEILKRQMDMYRRFRNTLRYLLGVLSGFDDVSQKVQIEDMPELERLILHKLYRLNETMIDCIKSYELQHFYTSLHTFCSNELSSFYFDISKDTLYCDSKDSTKRRACLTVMNEIFVNLVHWIAPLLSFTAEEAWKYYNCNNTSIHMNEFPKIPENWKNDDLNTKWKTIKSVRKSITAALEVERNAKVIGSSLEAEIFVYSTNADTTKTLMSVDIAEIAIVSKATVVTAQIPSSASVSDDIPEIGVVVKNASGLKCDRCWKIKNEVSSQGDVNLCDRCKGIVTA